MEFYGVVLKRLINFTNVKLLTIADAVGYDVSYVSKWCNHSKMPATRAASNINKQISKIFAEEIIAQGEFNSFCSRFYVDIQIDDLQNYINSMLKDAFKASQKQNDDVLVKKSQSETRVLINHTEITNFFETEFNSLIYNSDEPIEVLCTMDIIALSKANTLLNNFQNGQPKSLIHIKIGLNEDNLTPKELLYLYLVINKNHNISFDFYNNSTFRDRNIIAIKNKMVLMCSLDNHGKVETLSVISDSEKACSIFNRTEALFKIHHLLIMSMSSTELLQSGYRSHFYALDNYQIFLARGFEYLLPQDMTENIVKAAYAQGYDKCTEKILRKLAIAWEELFRNETLDFFMTKSDLIRYIGDGEFYFTDVVYRMSIEERKKHIQRVLELCEMNSKINFYIIDDESMPYPYKYAIFSLYSNGNKLFMKNTHSFYESKGPHFYSILSEPLIVKIGDAMNLIKKAECSSHFPGSSLKDFMKQYSAMVDRIISLSEIDNMY